MHTQVVQKLQRLDFSGCNTVRVQAAACAAASQPDALAAAVPALAAAQAPGVELVLCDLTLSPALTNSVRAAAAAGWQKASMYRVRLPADAPTAALPHATGSMVELTSLHPTPHMLVPAAAVVYSPYPPYVYTVGVPAVYHPMFQASGAAMPATQPPGLTTATLAYAHVASLQSAVPPAQLPRLQAAGLAAGTTQPYAPVPPAAGPTASAAAAATSAAAAAPTAPAAAQPTAQLPPLHTLSLHGPLTDTVLERLLPFVSPIDQFYAPELQLQLAVPDGVALPWRRLPAGRLQLSDWLPQAYLLGPSAGWKIECLDICLPLEMVSLGPCMCHMVTCTTFRLCQLCMLAVMAVQHDHDIMCVCVLLLFCCHSLHACSWPWAAVFFVPCNSSPACAYTTSTPCACCSQPTCRRPPSRACCVRA